MTWWTLLSMAGITFCCRYAFLTQLFTLQLSPRMERMLSYTAPSVLTAMWVPIVFLSGDYGAETWTRDPFLIAGLVTVVLSILSRQVLLVVGLGMGVFYLLKVLTSQVSEFV